MKKGYLFTLDAAIAILILIVGFTILYYQFAAENRTVYFTDRLSEDIIGVLAHTKVSDLCSLGSGCECPNYPSLNQLVCGWPALRSPDPTILEMLAEVIETGAHTGEEVSDAIHEIFVTNNVIDEKRFGFSVMYTDHTWNGQVPLELYNSETYP
jgi:hypothetical protein